MIKSDKAVEGGEGSIEQGDRSIAPNKQMSLKQQDMMVSAERFDL
jgi:hypothetical protein